MGQSDLTSGTTKTVPSVFDSLEIQVSKRTHKRAVRSESCINLNQSVQAENILKKAKTNCKTPDLTSLDLKCRVCSVQFKNSTRYRRHLVKIHGIKTKVIVEKSPKYALNLKYPNTYCDFCEIETFKIDRYRQHLIGLHDLDIESFQELEPLVEIKVDPDDPDYYCILCKTTMKDKSDYQDHLQALHRMRFKTGKIPFKYNSRIKDYDEPIPMVDNADNTCSDCKQTFININTFRRHLKFVHRMDDLVASSIKLKYIKQTTGSHAFLPSTKDVSFYCIECKLECESLFSYHNHKKKQHNLEIEWEFDRVLRYDYLNELYPEYCNSNFACQRCDGTRFENRKLFHDHLSKIHGDIIPPFECVSYCCSNAVKVSYKSSFKRALSTCLTCLSGQTIYKRLYATKPMIQKESEPQIAKFIPSSVINIKVEEEKSITLLQVPDAASLQAPAIKLGQSSLFSLEDSHASYEALKTSGSSVSGNDDMGIQTEYSDEKYDLKKLKKEDAYDEHLSFLKNEDTESLNKEDAYDEQLNFLNNEDTESLTKDSYYCSICSLRFEEENDHTKHLYIHCVELNNAGESTIPEKPSYTCVTCQCKYETKGRFIRHMKAVPHNSPEFDWQFKKVNREHYDNPHRSYSCPQCDWEFSSKEDHHNHLKLAHIDEIYKLKYIKSMVEDGFLPALDGFYIACNICNNAFSTLSDLYVHRTDDHPGYPVTQETETSRYYAHQKELGITSDYDDCYLCKLKQPKTGFMSQEHQMLHWLKPKTGKKQVYAINNIQDLDDFDIPMFYCGLCLYNLYSYFRYRAHMVKYHDVKRVFSTRKKSDPKITPDIYNSQFYCKPCDFKYATQIQFKRHVKEFHKMLLPNSGFKN